MKTISKKGQVSSMGPAIIALVIAGVFLILGLVVLQELRESDILRTGGAWCNASDVTGCSTAFHDSNTTIQGIASFADFWEIIVLAIVITIVIGLLLVVFGGRGRR